MSARRLFVIVVLSGGAVLARGLAGQVPAATREDSARVRALVVQARAQLNASRLDSAAALLIAAAANPAAKSGTVRAEIFLLLAIGRHFEGDPGGVAEAISEALEAEPALEAANLEAVAPGVARTLDAQRRCRAILGTAASVQAACAVNDLNLATTEPPELTGAPPPLYPVHLRRAGIEGRVLVSVVVDTLGRAEMASLQVLEAAHPDFIPPVREALAKAMFRPARAAGRAVPVGVTVPFNFYIGERPAEPGEVTAVAPLSDSGPIPVEVIRECIRRCRGGERKPALLSFPNLWALHDTAFPLSSGRTRQYVVVQFVVDQNGMVRAETIQVISSTARHMERTIRQALMQARFRPAMAGGEPVPARAQLRVEFRPEGTGLVTYRVSGP